MDPTSYLPIIIAVPITTLVMGNIMVALVYRRAKYRCVTVSIYAVVSVILLGMAAACFFAMPTWLRIVREATWNHADYTTVSTSVEYRPDVCCRSNRYGRCYVWNCCQGTLTIRYTNQQTQETGLFTQQSSWEPNETYTALYFSLYPAVGQSREGLYESDPANFTFYVGPDLGMLASAIVLMALAHILLVVACATRSCVD